MPNKKKLAGRVIVPVFGRDEIFSSIPWMASIPRGTDVKCMGHSGSRPLYAFWKMSDKEDTDPAHAEKMRLKREEEEKKSACKLKARWIYVRLDGTIKHLCTHHVYGPEGIEYWETEKDRFGKWVDEFYQSIDEVGGK